MFDLCTAFFVTETGYETVAQAVAAAGAGGLTAAGAAGALTMGDAVGVSVGAEAGVEAASVVAMLGDVVDGALDERRGRCRARGCGYGCWLCIPAPGPRIHYAHFCNLNNILFAFEIGLLTVRDLCAVRTCAMRAYAHPVPSAITT